MEIDEVFSEKLMMHTERYISRLGVPFVEKYEGAWETKLDDSYTVRLNMFGDMKGSFMFRIETSLAYSLVSHYILEAVNESEIPSYADKVIAEIINIVAGQTLSEEEDIHLYLGCPAVFLNSEIPMESELELGPVRSALTDDGIIQCMFIKE